MAVHARQQADDSQRIASSDRAMLSIVAALNAALCKADCSSNLTAIAQGRDQEVHSVRLHCPEFLCELSIVHWIFAL